MSDEEDYMSDKFLQGTAKSTSSSLIYRHADKRELELIKKKIQIEAKLKEKNAMKHIEEERREAGLSSAITSSNKGFELLMKMGYKPGHGIGKTESGITEPIGLQLKLDRQGLGKGIVKKNNKKTEGKSFNDELNNENFKNFRDRLVQKRTDQLLKMDLYKSQKICEQLDIQQKIDKPREAWFWLPVNETDSDTEEDNEEDDNEDDNSLPINEKLEILTKYLREKYFYCIWCGLAFQDEDDLKDNCPGSTRNDH